MTRPIVDSTCMGCTDGPLKLPHQCGGSKVPSDELGWRCVCPREECRQRQAGDWTGASRPNGSKRRRRPQPATTH